MEALSAATTTTTNPTTDTATTNTATTENKSPDPAASGTASTVQSSDDGVRVAVASLVPEADTYAKAVLLEGGQAPTVVHPISVEKLPKSTGITAISAAASSGAAGLSAVSAGRLCRDWLICIEPSTAVGIAARMQAASVLPSSSGVGSRDDEDMLANFPWDRVFSSLKMKFDAL